jgi:hypothetical protein
LQAAAAARETPGVQPTPSKPEVAAEPACPHCDAEVILDVVFDRGLLFLVLANVGDRPAHAVRVKFGAPLTGVGGVKRIDRLALFRKLEFLAPHKQIEVFLDRSDEFFARSEPTRLSAAISWRTADGLRRSASIDHDLEIYRDLGYIERKVPHRADPA